MAEMVPSATFMNFPVLTGGRLDFDFQLEEDHCVGGWRMRLDLTSHLILD